MRVSCDCGHFGHHQQKSIQSIEANVGTLALSFRTKTVMELQTAVEWRQQFWIDPQATPVTEDGQPAQNPDEYVETCKRPNKWFDAFCAQAAAEAAQRDLLVFKFTHNQWHFMHRYTPTKQVSKTPIPMFLKQGHFTTLDPAATMPEHWFDLTNEDAIIEPSFLGGVKSVSEKSMLSEKSPSLASWIQPVATPSDIHRHSQRSGQKEEVGSLSSWLRPCPSDAQSRHSADGKEDHRAGSLSSWLRPCPTIAQSPKPADSQRRLIGNSDRGQVGTNQTNTVAIEAQTKDLEFDVVPQPKSILSWDGSRKVRNFHRPKTILKRLWGKQSVDSSVYSEKHEWVCPVCTLHLSHKNAGGLSQMKIGHLRSRHPGFDEKLVKVPQKAEIFHLSEAIPESERDWTCPICKKGLSALPHQDRKRAIKYHCENFHPEHTCRSITQLARKGKKQSKEGVRKQQLKNHHKYRREVFASHQCIMMPQEKGSTDRGRLNFCRVCLSRLGKGGPAINNLSCSERLERIKNNPWVKKMKRDWWDRVKTRDPEWAREFLLMSQWNQSDLENLLAPSYKTEKARIAGNKRSAAWQAEKKKKDA